MSRKGRLVEVVKERVPPGTTLSVSVGPGNGKVYAGARFSQSGNKLDEIWKDKDLVPGPKVSVLPGGNAFMLEVDLEFLKSSDATVRAKLVAPDATVEDDIEWSFDPTTDDKLVVLLVATKT